jgi:FkbM family methyltransferase
MDPMGQGEMRALVNIPAGEAMVAHSRRLLKHQPIICRPTPAGERYNQFMEDITQITHRGISFLVRTGRHSSWWETIAKGTWEPETYKIFDRFIDKEHSYIDIGCWTGPTLLYGCQLAKQAYGIEPDPVAYAELTANIELNRPTAGNIKLFNIAITPSTGKVSFGSRTEGGDATSSLLFSQGKTVWTVDGVSLADFIQRNGIRDCRFIKIDIEGGEYTVLPSIAEYLGGWRPTIHLSLHPCFLGLAYSGLLGKLRRVASRFLRTITIIRSLSCYRHIYDCRGNELRPLRLLGMCLRHVTFEVVATDVEWS